MKNKFRQNIVIGVIAIVGTMGYNLSINQENENVRLITGNLKHWQKKKADWIATTIVIHRNVKFMLAPKVKSNYWVVL